MNRRGMNRFVNIERMLAKEKRDELEDDMDFELMDFRDDWNYI